ncbi:endolytic transglycosylase MltG [Flavobacterium sp.]|uniref:endolytic transglycosylase MltG n=1 Tax=Flavobacterium sp. TaxID=239 RepID=UPI0033416028
MNTKFKTLLIAAAGVFLVFAIVVYSKYFANNTKGVTKETFIEIPTDSNFDNVLKLVSPYVENLDDFKFIAGVRSYDENVKPGRFLIKEGMSSFGLVSALRRNMPVNLAFNNQERLENLCVRISSQIEPDTTKLLSVFRDSLFLKQNGFTKENVISMFIPNSYEFYWNVSAEKFRDKMLKEYKKFWTLERLIKAKKIGLSPVEVMTLASIVHKETVKKDERPKVARVYLNRLAQGMPLQADPTVIYAVKLRSNDFDQIIKRVLYADLSIRSPYNTYVNTGLPPGPIAMPDITAIDAVLSPDTNNYIYFCASVERFGYHEFAATYEEHQVNAKKYANWLNSTGTNR